MNNWNIRATVFFLINIVALNKSAMLFFYIMEIVWMILIPMLLSQAFFILNGKSDNWLGKLHFSVQKPLMYDSKISLKSYGYF